MPVVKLFTALTLIFLPRLGCHQWGARPPLRRGKPQAKNLKNKIRREKNQLFILPFTHTFAHSLLSVPEAMTPEGQSAT